MHPTTEVRSFHGGDLGDLYVIGCEHLGHHYWLVWDDAQADQVVDAVDRWLDNRELSFGAAQADLYWDQIERISSRRPGIVSIRELTPYGTGRTFSWSEAMAGVIAWLCVLLAGVVWFARAVLRS